MTTQKNVTETDNKIVEKVLATFAIPMDQEHYELIRAAAKVQGVPAAKFGRALILSEAARIMGVETPIVVEGKRGPKGGSKHPLAEKFGITTAEFNRRLAHYAKLHALSGSKKDFSTKNIDFSIDPFVKPVVEETEVQAESPLEVEAT